MGSRAHPEGIGRLGKRAARGGIKEDGEALREGASLAAQPLVARENRGRPRDGRRHQSGADGAQPPRALSERSYLHVGGCEPLGVGVDQPVQDASDLLPVDDRGVRQAFRVSVGPAAHVCDRELGLHEAHPGEYVAG